MAACWSDVGQRIQNRVILLALQALKEEELVRLLTEPRGALCKQYNLQFDLNDAGFVMTEVPHDCSCMALLLT